MPTQPIKSKCCGAEIEYIIFSPTHPNHSQIKDGRAIPRCKKCLLPCDIVHAPANSSSEGEKPMDWNDKEMREQRPEKFEILKDIKADKSISGLGITPTSTQSWESTFDFKFDHFNQQHSSKQICDADCENDYGLEDIKSFITQAIQEAREEEREALKKMCEELKDNEDYTDPKWPVETEAEKDGRNGALNDIINSL